MRLQESIAIFLSVGLALAFALPGVKSKSDAKTNVHTAASGLEEKSLESSITKEVNAGGDEDLDLLRAKKSPPTTTFCVEIKPGTDNPSVVVCDPNKKDQQVPFPGGTTTTIFPRPPEGQPIPDYIPNIPSIIPNNPQPPQEPPLIFIPQIPQILPQIPQILPPIYNPAQPQIIFVRDPSCNSNNPPINPYPWLANLTPTGGTYAQGNPLNPRSALLPMNIGHDQNQELWKSGFSLPQEEQIRSFGAATENSFSNPLDLIYSRRGPANRQQQLNPQQQPQQQQQNQNQNRPVLPPRLPQPPQQNLDSDGQYDRPLLIQCNPMVIPLSPEAYSAATGTGETGGWNRPWSRSANAPGSQMYTPMVSGSQGIYMAPNGYQRQSFLPQTGMIYPQSQTSGNAMMSQGQFERNAMPMVGGAGEGRENVPSKEQQDVKGGRGMSQEQQQQQSSGVAHPSTYVKGGGGQSVSQEQQIPHLMTHESHQQGLTKGLNVPGNGYQNGEAAAAHFSQGGMNDKEQGFQRQFQEFSQPQNHGQHVNQPGGKNDNSSGQLSSPGEMMRRMNKAAMSSGNHVQPFMMPVGMNGEKSIQSKA